MIEWEQPPPVELQTLGQTEEKSSGFGLGTLLLITLAAGTVGALLFGVLVQAPPPPVTTNQKTVIDRYGEPLTVAKVNGEWNYWYDGEWTPLRYMPGNPTVRGDKLVYA